MEDPVRRAKRAIAIGMALLVASCGRPSPRGLVLVTIDTCRADRLGCYGGGVGTSVLDGLAARGTLFEDVSAPAPLTSPSHGSLLTGLYPDRLGVHDNGGARLPSDAHTLAEFLQESGFRTAAFVSAFPLERRFGTDQGFDVYDDSLSSSSAGAATARGAAADDMARRFFYDERAASDVVDAALPWLHEAGRGDRPFFAWVHFFDPHADYRPPSRFAAQYGPRSYEGEIAYVDEQIGRLLSAVRTKGVTIAVVADHGESLRDHQEMTHGLFVYQSTIRVPCILAGPDVPAGRRVATPASLVDVLPTLLELLGLDPPEEVDGESLVPLLRGKAELRGDAEAHGDAELRGNAEPSARAIYGECLASQLHYGWAALRFVRRGGWKLIDAPTPELYDLAADPHETRNLAAERPELRSELLAVLTDHASRGGKLAADAVALDEASREKLEGLGYLGAGRTRPAHEDVGEGGADPKERVEFFNHLQEIPALMMDGRYDDAGRLLGQLHSEEPDNPDVLRKLAVLAKSQEKWAEAKKWCREVLRHDPDDVEWRRNLASALVELGDREAARAEYREILARSPEDAEVWGLLGSLLSEDGQHDASLVALERAVELAPRDAEIQAAHARALSEAGRSADAATAYDRALALDPALPAAVNGKALLLAREGRAPEAVQLLKGALPALEHDVDTLNNLAWILVDRSIDAAEGLEVARRARALAPDDPVVLDTFGWAATRAGRAAEGVEPLERAWRATANSEVRAHLGVALAAAGREAEGREHARAAVAARPDLARVAEIAKLVR